MRTTMAGHRRWAARPGPASLAALVAVLAVLALLALTVVTLAGRPGSSRRGGDPFAGMRMFVDHRSPAALAEASLARVNPAAAALLRKIASQPTGTWLGGWIPAAQVAGVVRTLMRRAAAQDSMPLLVLYAFPYHGCLARPTRGPPGVSGYERWIGQVAAGIGTRRAAVILEPDALALLAQPGCLPAAELAGRLALLRRAAGQLARSPGTAVYIDAGQARWRPPGVMAPLLLAAGVQLARGFSLNVSNFDSTASEERYGDRLSTLVKRAHYVIDTSRNGTATAATWCNPPGQALGTPPTAHTGNPLIDALLWIKPPGASDGPCRGGPQAGMFWLSYALGLAARAR